MLLAAATLSLPLAGCIGLDFPTAEQGFCTVAGIGCRPECSATLMPSASAAPRTLTYHLGPTSCAPVDFADANRQAGKLCRGLGLGGAISAAPLHQEAPVAPLPPTETAAFLCVPSG